MKRVIVILFEIFFLLLIVAIAITNICNTNSDNPIPDFWKVNVAQLITPLVALLIAFWATQFKNDQRKAKEHAERIIVSIQEIVSSDTFSVFSKDGNENNNLLIYHYHIHKNRKIRIMIIIIFSFIFSTIIAIEFTIGFWVKMMITY